MLFTTWLRKKHIAMTMALFFALGPVSTEMTQEWKPSKQSRAKRQAFPLIQQIFNSLVFRAQENVYFETTVS